MKHKFTYKLKPTEKLRQNYNQRKSKGVNSFESFDDFLSWYNLQKKECFYCGIEENVVQEIVMTGILNSARFPNKGIIARGKNRGVWLEVDRIEPKENYSRDNCVLSCYFCNNDKSDVFNAESYNKFKENRSDYLRSLIPKEK